jgi:two-component system sensor histidine kinase YesM
MKNKNSSYLSYRFLNAALVVLAFVILLIFILAFISISLGRYFFLLALVFSLFLAILYFCYRYVYLPYKETSKVLWLFAKGYTLQGIYELRYPFNPEMEATIKKIRDFINTNEFMSTTKRQAQYLALQNQINPHFLYNSLEGIRGEAISAGLNNVAEITEALATFFRYTISNVEKLVTVEDELGNIENYYTIQQYRFGDRLNLNIEYDSEEKAQILRYRLPKLTLQPIVENAIFHGIERKMGNGHVLIKIETTPKRLIITVSDDGLGIEEDMLKELNDKLNTQSFEYAKPGSDKKTGIGIINVNNRIKLLFGEEYGIYIYSTVNVGTDVEITLPLITNEGGNIK